MLFEDLKKLTNRVQIINVKLKDTRLLNNAINKLQ